MSFICCVSEAVRVTGSFIVSVFVMQLESLHTCFAPVLSVSVLLVQVNTGAAEVLYSAVGEWAQLDQDSTVLDVCCGTGTIGISLAKVRFDICSQT